MIKIQLIHHIISSYLMVTGDSSLRFQHTMNEESYLLYPLNHFRLAIRVFALHHALFFSPKEKILEFFLYTFQPRMFRKVLSKPKSKSSHCHRKCRRCAGTSHCLMFWWWMMVLVSPVLPWNTQIANQMLMIPFGY